MKQVIINKEAAKEARENDIKVYPTEEIVGSMKVVREFAAFASSHKIAIATLKASHLLDYCNTSLFTPGELNAFKLGLDVLDFFKFCESDEELYISQAEVVNRKSVG